MTTSKKILGFCIGAFLLPGCSISEGPSRAQQLSPERVPTPAAAAFDAAKGISSTGQTYEFLSVAGRTLGTEAGLAGSGRQEPAQESVSEFNALLRLQPLQVFEPETIIGTDDRRKVDPTTAHPERTNVLIALPNGRCSGALVGKDLVITAGHCVHSGGSAGSWMNSATVYPGKNGTASPFGSCQAKRFYSVLGWTRDKNPAYDFGAIKLNCDVGNRVGWLGFWWQSASLVGMQARISSYPGDKPLEQWTHTDQVRRESQLQTFYSTDTQPGNSGSGVFSQSGFPAGCGGPCVHTVHAYGAGSTNTNSGTRITQPLFDNLVRWKAEP